MIMFLGANAFRYAKLGPSFKDGLCFLKHLFCDFNNLLDRSSAHFLFLVNPQEHTSV